MTADDCFSKLNTSRFAQTLDFSEDLTDNSNVFEDFIEDAAGSVEDLIESSVGNLVHKSGLEDFYSAHIMNYCSGMYTSEQATNETDEDEDEGDEDEDEDESDESDDSEDSDDTEDEDDASDDDEADEADEADDSEDPNASKDVSFCSEEDAFYHFDPLESIKKSIERAGLSDTISAQVVDALPDALDDAITALRTAYRVIFVLYCMGIALAFLSMVFSLLGIFVTKRMYVLINAALANLACLSLGIASAVVTAVVVEGAKAVNKFGEDVGIVAERGDKFLGLTWAATLLMLVAFAVWLVHVFRSKKQVAKMG